MPALIAPSHQQADEAKAGGEQRKRGGKRQADAFSSTVRSNRRIPVSVWMVSVRYMASMTVSPAKRATLRRLNMSGLPLPFKPSPGSEPDVCKTPLTKSSHACGRNGVLTLAFHTDPEIFAVPAFGAVKRTFEFVKVVPLPRPACVRRRSTSQQAPKIDCLENRRKLPRHCWAPTRRWTRQADVKQERGRTVLSPRNVQGPLGCLRSQSSVRLWVVYSAPLKMAAA
jgi:hypothetical protein